jgi:RNA polymerase sigma factor (sigma-70 family)
MINSYLAYSDEQYINALKVGDDRIIQDLYNKAYRLSHTAIRKLGIDEESVSEIYQDSFCVLYENAQRPGFRLTSELVTYLVGVCKNKAKEYYRKKIGNRDFSELGGSEIGTVDAFENDYEQAEEARRALFLEEFNRMKENKKDCYSLIKLSFLEEESSARIAQILNKGSIDVVKTQKSRCLSYLRKAIFKRM